MGRKNKRKIVKEIKHSGKAGVIKEKRSERNRHRKQEIEKKTKKYKKRARNESVREKKETERNALIPISGNFESSSDVTLRNWFY